MGDRSTAGAGYANASYAASLAEHGEPRLLPRSRGSLLVREIPGTSLRDAMGPYPVFACADWSGLPADIAALRGELVSVSLVTDPFADVAPADLARAFPDLMVPFKEHFVVDLRGPWRDAVHRHHRRNARRALAELDVELVDDPLAVLDDWVALYDGLVRRHRIRGIATFSRRSFAAQLEVPGIVALRAVRDGATVGATLWYASGDVAYYHLGAYSERGYELGASFALFETALEHFAAEGVGAASLGAGAGVGGGASDGLSRFKRGWATETRTAMLCGAVLAAERYRELAGTGTVEYFPAYRAGEFT